MVEALSGPGRSGNGPGQQAGAANGAPQQNNTAPAVMGNQQNAQAAGGPGTGGGNPNAGQNYGHSVQQ